MSRASVSAESTMVLRSTDSKRFVLGLVALCSGAACTGTPTPDPPDFLPTPNGMLILVGVAVEANPASVDVPIEGMPGAVERGSDVWVVNLDDQAVEPERVHSGTDGSFLVSIEGKAGDRLRLVSRTADRHSRPFDLEVVQAGELLGVRPLMDTSLACLEVTPPDELSIADESGFVIHNGCTAAVKVTRAALRLGDQGFALGASEPTIAVGAELRLDVSVSGGNEDADELADILLLDVQNGTKVGRYALGLWNHQ
jgi:hypothetical protein